MRRPFSHFLPLLLAVGLLTVGLLPAGIVHGEDWPHWRGPTHDGVSDEVGLPVEWDTENSVVWKVELPAWSGATPIISGDTIFLNVSIPADPSGVPANPSEGYGRRRGGGAVSGRGNVAYSGHVEFWALDRNDGSVRWIRHLSDRDRRGRKQNMSSPSPVTDGEHVFVLTGTGSPQGLRLRRNGALVPQHSGGLRRLRPQLGLREQPAPVRGRHLRAGSPRNEDRRSVLRSSD